MTSSSKNDDMFVKHQESSRGHLKILGQWHAKPKISLEVRNGPKMVITGYFGGTLDTFWVLWVTNLCDMRVFEVWYMNNWGRVTWQMVGHQVAGPYRTSMLNAPCFDVTFFR